MTRTKPSFTATVVFGHLADLNGYEKFLLCIFNSTFRVCFSVL